MTNTPEGARPSRPIDGGDHASILALLPEYVTIQALGQRVSPEWGDLERHIARCDLCRSQAEGLLALMRETYAAPLPAAGEPPPPDLSFLPSARQAASRQPPRHLPGRTAAGAPEGRTFVLSLSPALLARMPVHGATRTEGSRLRYALEIPPSPGQPAITLEVFTPGEDLTHGLVRICVEDGDRSPFEQADTLVVLGAGDLTWSGLTDTNGVVVFSEIPLAAIERWQISASPPPAEPPAG